MKIYLIGYMGSGKSTIGRMVADQMKLDFIDFDTYIEGLEKKTVAEIFDSNGENKFRELEHEHLKKLLNEDNCVISLGGGTPCFHNNLALIRENGTSVYLEMDVATLVNRLYQARNKRPLIRGLNKMELKYFIEANLEKRKPIYQQAHFSVSGTGRNKEEIVEEINKKLNSGLY